MAHVPTFMPLVRAVEEALTTDTGASYPRRLGADDLFALGFPPTMADHLHARDARVQKRCFVSISDQTVDDLFLEMGDEHRLDVVVSVTRWYWLRWEGIHSDVRTAMVSVADDFAKIRKALCWPGALATDATGDGTGLAGNALSAKGARDLTTVRSIDTKTRLVTAVARFRGSVFLATAREHTFEYSAEFT